MAQRVTMFTMKNTIEDKKDPNKKYYPIVGKVGIREDGKGGFVRLNHLPGDFALFRDEPKEDEASSDGAADGETPKQRGEYRGRQAPVKERGNNYVR